MKVTRTSPFDGRSNTMEMDITHEQMDSYEYGRSLIQDIFPNLTPAEREFIKTGYTSEDWDKIFG